MTPNVIWVTGHSGVGKSSVLHGIKSILKCDIINTGEIIRKNFPKAKSVTDSEIFKIIGCRLANRQTNLILFDNFPFNQNQFEIWNRLYKPPIQVILLKNNDDAKQRKLDRGRVDDTLSDFLIRKSQFQKEIIPILKILETQNLLSIINASKPLQEIVKNTFKLIDDILSKLNISLCDMTSIIVKKHKTSARIPERSTPFSPTFDIFTYEDIIIPPYKTITHHTWASVIVPTRSVAVIQGIPEPISCLVHQKILHPSPEGQFIELTLTNLSTEPIFLEKSAGIAQFWIPTSIYSQDHHRFIS